MNDSEILIKQDKMSSSFFSAWLIALTTIQWITLDMYLPALPVLKEQFAVSEGMLNISLNAGILTTAIGTLFGGSISDRFGRKAVVAAGTLISAAGTLACAAAQGIVLLSVMRGIAGLGSGVVETVTAAMVKDSYSGKKFQSTMTILQASALIGPVCAPSLGALLINFGSWRYIFVFLTVIILISGIPLFFCKETLPKENRIASNMKDVVREAKAMCQSSFFVIFLVIMALVTMPVWAYIGESSYVIINEFGESNTMYGLYYAVGSVMSLIAPFIYMFLARKMGVSKVVSIILALLIISGAELLSIGRISPVLFMLGAILMLVAEGMIRPLGMVVLLEAHAEAAGTASSLIGFILNIVAIIGTTVATIGWSSMVFGLGIITLVCCLGAVILWWIMVRLGLTKKMH